MANKISEFKGEFFCFSNFAPISVKYDGILYPTAEAAFQAAKTTDFSIRKKIAACKTPDEAKRIGRHIQLRPDWEEIKVDIMYEIVLIKVMSHPDLRIKLKSTWPRILEEGNTWNDTFWGVCNGKGLNNLGKILTKIRNL